MKIRNPFKDWNADRWIAFSVFIIAICAFSLTLWQSIVIKNYNRISVRPLVTISGSKNQDGSGWKMGNSGFGPALVKWFEVTVEGKTIKDWKEFGKELGMPDNFTHYYWVPSSNTAIPPREPMNLFWVLPGDTDTILRTNEKAITMRICYCSVYNECWLASGGRNAIAYQACENQPNIQFGPSPNE